MQRQWRRYNTPNGKKMFRYTMVSVISTVFGFTLLGIVFGVLHLWSEVPSALFVNLVGLCPRTTSIAAGYGEKQVPPIGDVRCCRSGQSRLPQSSSRS